MVRALENSSIPTVGQAPAGGLSRGELDQVRVEIREAIARQRAELERLETLLLAVRLHERGGAPS